MPQIKFNAAPNRRFHHVAIAHSDGCAIPLRLNGPKTERVNPARSALTADKLSWPKATAPSSARVNVVTARVMPHVVAMELPWSVRNVTAAVQKLPDVLRGTLLRGAATLLAPRMASLALPVVTLTAALYSSEMGDASLPGLPKWREVDPEKEDAAFVPLAPQDSESARGFKPLAPNESVLAGIPGTTLTRPATPLIRELPVSGQTQPQLHEGGPPIELVSVPGRARWTPEIQDALHLKEDAETHASDAIADLQPPQKEELRFSNVVVNTTAIETRQRNDLFAVPDTRVSIEFHAGQQGQGKISIRWPNPGHRTSVQVEIEKNSQLPNRLTGEILAHALGHTHGFIPSESLRLQVRDVDGKTSMSDDSVDAIARWAMAMHGKRVYGRAAKQDSGYLNFDVGSGFRAKPYFFEKPIVVTGHPADGPGVEDPKVFLDLYPRGELKKENQQINIFPARNLTLALGQQLGGEGQAVNHLLLSYVVPVPSSSTQSAELQLGVEATHGQIARGRAAVSGVGLGAAVYDPDFGKNGGFRMQWMAEPSGAFKARGKKAKEATEIAFQQVGLDGDGRWFPVLEKPVSIEPFAGLQVHRESSAVAPLRYVIKVPDARAISYKGAPNPQEQNPYQDLASLVIEPVMSQNGQMQLAHISQVNLDDEMRSFLPTFVGQALAAVQSKHPVTAQHLPFMGIRVSALLFEEWLRKVSADAFADGLTIYGLEKNLGQYSPETDFVLQRDTGSGDIEFVINPKVLSQP